MKKNFFRRTLMVIGVSIVSLSALAATTPMSAGSSSGGYTNRICPAIAAHVRTSTNGSESISCKTSDGTGMNFDNALTGDPVLGLGQLDVIALKYMEKEDSDEIIGTLGFIDVEALHCVAKKGGRIPEGSNAWPILNDEEHPEKPFVISTAGEASGSAGTIKYLRTSFGDFEKSTKHKMRKKFKFESEMGRLRSGKRDMVCFVTSPNPSDANIESVVTSRDLFFVELSSPELATLQIDGNPVYEIQEVPVSGGMKALIGFGKKVKTITTGVTVIINEDEAEDGIYGAIVKAVRDPNLIPAKTLAEKLVRKMREAKGAAIDAYSQVKKAAE